MQLVNCVPFDRAEMLERLAGDTELLDEVLVVFREECPRMMKEVREAVAGGDPELVRRTAHSIKGALLNISAVPAAAHAGELEALGREDRLAESGALLDQLQSEIERLQEALSEQTAG